MNTVSVRFRAVSGHALFGYCCVRFVFGELSLPCEILIASMSASLVNSVRSQPHFLLSNADDLA